MDLDNEERFGNVESEGGTLGEEFAGIQDQLISTETSESERENLIKHRQEILKDRDAENVLVQIKEFAESIKDQDFKTAMVAIEGFAGMGSGKQKTATAEIRKHAINQLVRSLAIKEGIEKVGWSFEEAKNAQGLQNYEALRFFDDGIISEDLISKTTTIEAEEAPTPETKADDPNVFISDEEFEEFEASRENPEFLSVLKKINTNVTDTRKAMRDPNFWEKQLTLVDEEMNRLYKAKKGNEAEKDDYENDLNKFYDKYRNKLQELSVQGVEIELDINNIEQYEPHQQREVARVILEAFEINKQVAGNEQMPQELLKKFTRLMQAVEERSLDGEVSEEVGNRVALQNAQKEMRRANGNIDDPSRPTVSAGINRLMNEMNTPFTGQTVEALLIKGVVKDHPIGEAWDLMQEGIYEWKSLVDKINLTLPANEAIDTKIDVGHKDGDPNKDKIEVNLFTQNRKSVNDKVEIYFINRLKQDINKKLSQNPDRLSKLGIAANDEKKLEKYVEKVARKSIQLADNLAWATLDSSTYNSKRSTGRDQLGDDIDFQFMREVEFAKIHSTTTRGYIDGYRSRKEPVPPSNAKYGPIAHLKAKHLKGRGKSLLRYGLKIDHNGALTTKDIGEAIKKIKGTSNFGEGEVYRYVSLMEKIHKANTLLLGVNPRKDEINTPDFLQNVEITFREVDDTGWQAAQWCVGVLTEVDKTKLEKQRQNKFNPKGNPHHWNLQDIIDFYNGIADRGLVNEEQIEWILKQSGVKPGNKEILRQAAAVGLDAGITRFFRGKLD